MRIHGTIKVSKAELDLAKTLVTGQNFRWFKNPNPIEKDQNFVEEWIGILQNRHVVALWQNEETLYYRLLNEQSLVPKSDIEIALKNYFRLDVDLEKLYESWSKCDKNFQRISAELRGIRLLRQDPIENIFSFICSANNNISRITQMIEKLAQNYGTELVELSAEKTIYSFPNIEALSKVPEEDLRKNGFGYRAKSIVGTAKKILKESESEGGIEVWISNLMKLDYFDCRKRLLSLPGIGPKVADCICLMSFGHVQSVPIDTHVQQVTLRFYKTRKDLKDLKLSKTNSITKKNYDLVGNFYRKLFGSYAGWAQTVLFCSNLLKTKR